MLVGIHSALAPQALLARLARPARLALQGPRALLRKTLAPLAHLARPARPVAQLGPLGHRATRAQLGLVRLVLWVRKGLRGQEATRAQQGLRAHGATWALEATKELRGQ